MGRVWTANFTLAWVAEHSVGVELRGAGKVEMGGGGVRMKRKKGD